MKPIRFIRQSAAALIVAAVTFTDCEEEKHDDPKAPAINMTTAKEDEVEISLTGTGTAVINWGDSSAPEMVTRSAYAGSSFTVSQRHTHTFSGITHRTIAIDGRNITHLACDNMELKVLDVTKILHWKSWNATLIG